jgi:hypothetical protein
MDIKVNITKNKQNTPWITKEPISLCRKKKVAYKKAIEIGKGSRLEIL